MKSLIKYILEKRAINRNNAYNYYPTNKNELKAIIKKHYDKGIYDLNDIDVSNITDFNSLFYTDKNTGNKDFNISGWNVSNGKDFAYMFHGCDKFNNDLSNWDVSNAEDFSGMFNECTNFNSDLSKWYVGNSKNFSNMFYMCSNFDSDLSRWATGGGDDFSKMFYGCENFSSNLSKWDITHEADTYLMCHNCGVADIYKPEGVQ